MKLKEGEETRIKKVETGKKMTQNNKGNRSLELLSQIARSGVQNSAFFLADADQLKQNVADLTDRFPEITPYFDVNLNANPWLLNILADYGVGFRVQNKADLQHLVGLGRVDPAGVSFNGSLKTASVLKFAEGKGINTMSFESMADLKKIAKSAPGEKLLMGLHPPTGNPVDDRQWLENLNAAKNLGLEITGVKLDLGRAGIDKMAALTKAAFSIGRSIGHPMKTLDLGAILEEDIDDIKRRLNGLGNDLEIRGHFGLAIVEDVFTLGVKIIGKRESNGAGQTLIVNDSVFNSFGGILAASEAMNFDIKPLTGTSDANSRCVATDILGSRGDDLDVVGRGLDLADNLAPGDWLSFTNMGAYSMTTDSNLASMVLPGTRQRFWMFMRADDNLNNAASTEEPEMAFTIPEVLNIYLDVNMIGNLGGLDEIITDFYDAECAELFTQLPDFCDNDFDNIR